MLRAVVVIVLVFGRAHAAPCQIGATRCHAGVIEECYGEKNPRWRKQASCVVPLICVEEVAGRAQCVEPGVRARMQRAVTRGAAYGLIYAFIITRAIRGH